MVWKRLISDRFYNGPQIYSTACIVIEYFIDWIVWLCRWHYSITLHFIEEFTHPHTRKHSLETGIDSKLRRSSEIKWNTNQLTWLKLKIEIGKEKSISCEWYWIVVKVNRNKNDLIKTNNTKEENKSKWSPISFHRQCLSIVDYTDDKCCFYTWFKLYTLGLFRFYFDYPIFLLILRTCFLSSPAQ